jgi:hypothetical protein
LDSLVWVSIQIDKSKKSVTATNETKGKGEEEKRNKRSENSVSEYNDDKHELF